MLACVMQERKAEEVTHIGRLVALNENKAFDLLVCNMW
jgi:hypothetical protein